MKGKSTGKGSAITERAAASPGAAQKSMDLGVGVEEEEVFRRIQSQNSTIYTSNTDTARLLQCKFSFIFLCKNLVKPPFLIKIRLSLLHDI